MGMDMGLIISKSKKLLETDWDDILDYDEIKENPAFIGEYGEFNYPDICIVWYARKFWDMVQSISILYPKKSEDFVLIKKDTLKEMIQYYCFHPDYFNGFAGLPRLCELYQEYDRLIAEGFKFWFWISY